VISLVAWHFSPAPREIFVSDFIRPISAESLSESWGLLQRHTFELRRRNGEWQKQVRETYDRGDGAAVLLCDIAEKAVILIRQFRYPAFYRGETPYLIEVCAGKLEGDSPEACAHKEALEECGYRLESLDQVTSAFMSPGSVTERLTLFIGRIDAQSRIADGGGLAHEGEDIEILNIPFDTALSMIETGEIIDSKTIILLQHAAIKGIFA
jgi:GDP-mannose pyrophosphatase NudK